MATKKAEEEDDEKLPRQPRQAQIPGTEGKRYKELDDAGQELHAIRKKRMKLSEKEGEAVESVLVLMRKHGLEIYRDDSVSPPLILRRKPGKEGVKVELAGGADDEDAEE